MNRKMLTDHTKTQVDSTCVVSTLLYGNETRTFSTGQERRFASFHMHSMRRIFNLICTDKLPNSNILEYVGIMSIFTLFRQQCLRWLGCVPSYSLWQKANTSGMVNSHQATHIYKIKAPLKLGLKILRKTKHGWTNLIQTRQLQHISTKQTMKQERKWDRNHLRETL